MDDVPLPSLIRPSINLYRKTAHDKPLHCFYAKATPKVCLRIINDYLSRYEDWSLAIDGYELKGVLAISDPFRVPTDPLHVLTAPLNLATDPLNLTTDPLNGLDTGYSFHESDSFDVPTELEQIDVAIYTHLKSYPPDWNTDDWLFPPGNKWPPPVLPLGLVEIDVISRNSPEIVRVTVQSGDVGDRFTAMKLVCNGLFRELQQAFADVTTIQNAKALAKEVARGVVNANSSPGRNGDPSGPKLRRRTHQASAIKPPPALGEEANVREPRRHGRGRARIFQSEELISVYRRLYLEQNLERPTYTDIAQQLGVSVRSVERRVSELRKAGEQWPPAVDDL